MRNTLEKLKINANLSPQYTYNARTCKRNITLRALISRREWLNRLFFNSLTARLELRVSNSEDPKKIRSNQG